MKNLKPFLFFPVFVILSCQSFNSVVQEPRVSLNSVSITGISFSAVDLVAHVNVENPNAFSIPLPNIDWELFVNTARFIQGSLKNDKTIKGRDKTTLDLPVRVTYAGLYQSFKSLFETKEAAYEIALALNFPLPVIRDKVYNLDFSGVIPVPQLPKLSPGQMKVSKIDFSGIELSCGINVENPNKFPVPVPKINWDYSINEVPVLKSSLSGGAGEIAAGAAAAAVVTVSVAYADIFRAVDSARNKGEAKSNLSLGFDPRDIGFPIPAADTAEDKDSREEKTKLDIAGVIPILRKPEVSFKGIAKKSLGATMEFMLNWEVDNPNNFSFDINEFQYGFKVNNSLWAQGRLDKPPQVKANGKTAIPITATVSALSLVKELVDIINRGTPVNFDCTGNMSLSADFPGLDKVEFPLNQQGSTRIQ